MFEKEAEEYVMREDVVTENNKVPFDNGYGYQTVDFEKEVKQAFKDGAEFGYNKANEWHFVKDELPKGFGYFLVALKHNAYKGFVFEVAYFIGSIFTKDGEVLDNVYAWKEIVLPELPKEIVNA